MFIVICVSKCKYMNRMWMKTCRLKFVIIYFWPFSILSIYNIWKVWYILSTWHYLIVHSNLCAGYKSCSMLNILGLIKTVHFSKRSWSMTRNVQIDHLLIGVCMVHEMFVWYLLFSALQPVFSCGQRFVFYHLHLDLLPLFSCDQSCVAWWACCYLQIKKHAFICAIIIKYYIYI